MADYSKEADVLVFALIDAHNRLHDAFTSKDGYNSYHRDVSCVVGGDFRSPTLTVLQVASPAATNLATTSTLSNELFAVLHAHMNDDSAHLAVDTVNDGYMTLNTKLGFPASGDDLTTVQNRLNDVKKAFNAHLTQAGIHVVNDLSNAVATANATDLASAEALANALKSAMNIHIKSGPLDLSGAPIPRIRTVPK